MCEDKGMSEAVEILSILTPVTWILPDNERLLLFHKSHVSVQGPLRGSACNGGQTLYRWDHIDEPTTHTTTHYPYNTLSLVMEKLQDYVIMLLLHHGCVMQQKSILLTIVCVFY